MTKFFRELFKYEKTENWLIKLMHNFEVHSNESACRRSGGLGLEQVITHHDIVPSIHTPKLVEG